MRRRSLGFPGISLSGSAGFDLLPRLRSALGPMWREGRRQSVHHQTYPKRNVPSRYWGPRFLGLAPCLVLGHALWERLLRSVRVLKFLENRGAWVRLSPSSPLLAESLGCGNFRG